MKTIYVLLNGNAPKVPPISRDDFVIAADGGIRHAPFYPIDVWIGDFDSSDFNSDKAKKIIRFSPEKDATDWELVLQYIAENFNENIQLSIIGATGFEYDHLLANFFVLANYSFRAIIHTEIQKIIYFSAPFAMEFITKINSNFSLLALTNISSVSSCGLYWELNGKTINNFSAFACRNKTKSENVVIQIDNGKGLIFLPIESQISIKSDKSPTI